ncbi:MAG: PKD domain-containing protein [Bacteroidota bacterium]
MKRLFTLFALLALTATFVQAQCTAGFTWSTTPFFATTFTDMSQGAGQTISSWSWDFGDGNTSTAQNPSHNYSQPGVYIVCLTITAGNCMDIFCDSVFISQGGGGGGVNCTASISGSVTSSVGSFTASGTGTGVPVSYAWDFGDGNNSTTTTSSTTHNYNAPGPFTVCVTITYSDGCVATSCGTYGSGGGGGNPWCNASFTSGSAPAGGFAFTDGSTASGSILSYSWTFGDGNTSNLQNPTHTYSGNGPYQVCLTITTSDSCSSTYCDSVLTGGGGGGNWMCQSNYIWYPDTSQQYSIIVVNQAQNAQTYLWDFGDGNTSTQAFPMHTYSGPGSYLVCLTVTGVQNCTSIFCDTITVTNKMMSAFTINVVSPLTSVTPPAPEATPASFFPNPASDFLHVGFALASDQNVSVQLYDLQGRTVHQQAFGTMGSGEHVLDLDLQTLPAGMYMVRLETGDQVEVSKLMLNR